MKCTRVMMYDTGQNRRDQDRNTGALVWAIRYRSPPKKGTYIQVTSRRNVATLWFGRVSNKSVRELYQVD